MYVEPSEPSGWSLITSGISCLAIYYAMTRPRRSKIINEDELNTNVSLSIESPVEDLSPEEQLLTSINELRSMAEEHLSDTSIPQSAPCSETSRV